MTEHNRKFIKLHFNKDFRTFKEGEDIELKLSDKYVNYIVGPNGCGKSTISQLIRAKRHDLRDINKNMFDGMSNLNDQILNDDATVTIEGLDAFDNIFVLDSVDDNPTSFNNAATASALLMGGGMFATQHSNGQNAQMILSSFMTKIAKVTNFGPKQYKAGERYDKSSLIIIDEADNGLDISMQARFAKILDSLATVYNATVICITHNSFTILASDIGSLNLVYNVQARKPMSIKDYIKEQTGLIIDVHKAETEV